MDKQVYIYSVGTDAFYNDSEMVIHNKLSRLHINKKSVRDKLKKISKSLEEDMIDEEKEILLNRKVNLLKARKKSTFMINKYKMTLKKYLDDNDSPRELREDSLKDSSKIGMFDSALTRTIGMKIDSVSTSLIVIRVYYYQILKKIIQDGFTYNGEKYIYFSSSAGQIRTKKAVFIKESLWKQHEGALTCGLSIDEINNRGGCNVNKLLAYKALTASASQKWLGFDIDRAIVVPDLETSITSEFDYIDRETYEIERKEMNVSIEHTDGCGMILPKKSKKSFMVRLPYVKGLLVPFPFDKFAEEHGKTKLTDVYGKEWDIVEDDIQIVFTSSQFKMKKYYDDWEDYKTKFKENKCQAVKLNEEDIGENATLNYQMLQTLTDISNEEMKSLASKTVEDILKIGSDRDTMLRVLGATKANKNKNYYQEALYMYPEMLNDKHSKKIIKDKKKAMVRDARAGKLHINGKYTYLIPDLYAFCERIFLKKEPNGLLSNGEVYCNIYDEGKLDILRSPHLYKEHCIRNNRFNEERKKWFITNGIYTSIFDPISRILQFDNDGDKALVIQDDLFVEIAERNMKGVVPLYYEMGAAKPEIIKPSKIYDSLLLAFKANIGEVSNNITKVFNSEDIDLRVVKWLTAENNYIIDFAKTLYMPKRPEKIDLIIKEYIKSKLPFFFMEAKDKEKHQVAPINNSTVNRLRKIIPNKTIKFEEIAGEFNYRFLMSSNVKIMDENIIKTYRRLDRSKKMIIRNSKSKSRKEGTLYVYKHIRDELRKILDDEERIVNILVEELYGNTDSEIKTTLWNCYGDIMLRNLKDNLAKTKQCESCGCRFTPSNNSNKHCKDCVKIEWKKYNAQKQREYRLRKKRV